MVAIEVDVLGLSTLMEEIEGAERMGVELMMARVLLS